MEAKVSERDGVAIIELQGRMSFESVDRFRLRCFAEWTKQPLVFNLQNLSFVGSNGISTFLETLQQLATVSPGNMRLCHVGSEFRRIFEASGLAQVGFFETEEAAFRSLFAAAASPITLARPSEANAPDRGTVGDEKSLMDSPVKLGLNPQLAHDEPALVLDPASADSLN